MSFSAEWLALRAGFDSAARSRELEARLAAWAACRTANTGRPLAVVDLGAGSGNNRRHLAPRLPVAQAWTLVDADPALLAAARDDGPDVTVLQADLASDVEAAIPAGTDLITASALIDLVSESWLERLLARADAVAAALLVVLTYDGHADWDPPDRLDRTVIELFNRHQSKDKGFGPALGPEAGKALTRIAGRHPLEARSDWVVGPADAGMRRALVDAWAEAAAEIEPAASGEIGEWSRRSRDRSGRLTVGHVDQLLLPCSREVASY